MGVPWGGFGVTMNHRGVRGDTERPGVGTKMGLWVDAALWVDAVLWVNAALWVGGLRCGAQGGL